MPLDKHYYKNVDITVVWQPGLCMHSATCFKGLPQVFDPRKKPWIAIGKSDTLTIINQIKKCPSGALSFHANEETAEQL